MDINDNDILDDLLDVSDVDLIDPNKILELYNDILESPEKIMLSKVAYYCYCSGGYNATGGYCNRYTCSYYYYD